MSQATKPGPLSKWRAKGTGRVMLVVGTAELVTDQTVMVLTRETPITAKTTPTQAVPLAVWAALYEPHHVPAAGCPGQRRTA